MDIRDTLSAELPSPRDDEPAGLRQDIVDELADHLACAYNRELLRGVAAAEARERVLHRFGDPAAVARRLWLDAMKGKIMAQRALIATCLVLTLASLSLAGIMWQQAIHAQREAVRQAAEAAYQAAEARRSQEEMLKHLREVSEGIRTSRALDWNPVTFTLTEETAEGPPAVGVSIAFGERVLGNPGAGMAQFGGMKPAAEPGWRVTDGSGTTNFGVVHPGDYSFAIIKSWDQGSLATLGDLTIEPGSQVNKRIVCPKTPPERVPVRVRWNWPADLQKQGLVLYAGFAINPIDKDGLSWTLTDERLADPAGESSRPPRMRRMGIADVRPSAIRYALCGPAASMAEVRASPWPLVWTLLSEQPQKLRIDFRASDLRKIQEPAETLKWESGSYVLTKLIVLRPSEPDGTKAVRKRFEIVSSGNHPGWWSTGAQAVILDSPPAEDETEGSLGPRIRARTGSVLNSAMDLPMEFWNKSAKGFEARPDRVNEWTIPLPDELIKAVRERLK
jgi:hypothetical protein